jgi:hypothetical protein
VILIEAVIKPGNEPDLSKLIDLEMLLLPGGRESTADEFAALLPGAGSSSRASCRRSRCSR